LIALRRAALFAAALLVLLAVFAPLRFALDRLGLERQGLAAADVRGTVWSGRLVGASWRGLQLGDAAVGLQPLPLLLGRTRLTLETGAGGPSPGRAVLVRAGGTAGVEDATLDLPVRLLNTPVPLRGELRVQDASVLFRDGACLRAEGRVATDLLQRSAEFLQWQGPELSGRLACRGGALVLPLTGARDGTQVSTDLRLEGDGDYRLDTRVLTSDLGLGAALALAGFERRADGLARVDQGRWGG